MLCKRCEKEVADAGFYASSPTICKECVKVRVRSHRKGNVERIRAYDRARADLPHRAEARKAAAHLYYNAPAKHEWRVRNPQKTAAHQAVRRAIKAGKLVCPKVCEDCPSLGPLHAHHDDYSQPLAVRWLCVPCHGAAHRTLNELRRAEALHGVQGGYQMAAE